MSEFLFRGLTTFLSGKYNETLLSNLENLRNKFQCTLPVEIWHNGEMEEELKEKLLNLENINFMNVNNFISNAEKWNEESLKSVMIFYSEFQETIVFNDNVVFHLDPFNLTSQESYPYSGMVLFSYQNKKFTIDEKYVEFAKKIVNYDSDTFPIMQKYIFSNTLDVNQKEYLVDNNVMLINRTININVVSKLLKHYQEMYKNDEIYDSMFYSQGIWLMAQNIGKNINTTKFPCVELPRKDEQSEKVLCGFGIDKLLFTIEHDANENIVRIMEENATNMIELEIKENQKKIAEEFAKRRLTKEFIEEDLRIASRMYADMQRDMNNNEITNTINIQDSNEDIQTIMQQTECSQELAEAVFKEQNGDIVDSIMVIHELQENNKVSSYLQKNMPVINEENEEEQEEEQEEEMHMKVEEIKEEVKKDIEVTQKMSAKNKLQRFKEKRKSA